MSGTLDIDRVIEGANCVFLDARTLRYLYVDDRLTTADIARRLHCSPRTVRRQLIRFGIPARPRGPTPRRGSAADVTPFAGWSSDVAYAVGLLATDGNVARTRPVISIVSKDIDLLATVRRCLGVPITIKPHRGGYSDRCHHLTWRDRRLYDWLLSIGLIPAKSLTLGPVAVPDKFFADFFRGCIDGDGSILTYTDRYHASKNERYVYERLYVSIVSASPNFIEWLRGQVARINGITGSIRMNRRPGKKPIWKLRYAKADSLRLARVDVLLSDRSLPRAKARHR